MPGLFIQRHAAVAARFADVSVIYLRAVPECKPGIEIADTIEFNCNTIRVYYGTNTKLKGFLRTAMRAWLFVKAFFKAISYYFKNYGRPDKIHVNVLTRLGFLALLLKIIYNIPYVITEHWSRYLPITGTYKGFLRKITTKIVVQYADAMSTVSHNLAHAMQAHGLNHQKYILLPNVVDFERYTIIQPKTKTPKTEILHVSCFEDKSKNISGLLRVIHLLSMQRSDFHVSMVGEGVDLELLLTYSKSLGLTSEIVSFKGLLENDELISEYQKADFLIMFSNYENMPVVISEAFACGLPVLATAVGGIPEFVNNTNGCLVKPADESDLLQKCNFMIDSIDTFDRHKIRSEAAAYFSHESVANALRNLYDID